MLAAYSLAQLLHMCAPDVGARTMTAIIEVESGGNPLAIHDNTLDRSFAPRDSREAIAWANQLLKLHHSVDLGLSQINNANLPRLGLSVPEVFDACTNASAGSLILALDYRTATQQFGAGQYALRHAIGAYNSGSIYAGYDYIDRILAAAGLGASKAIAVPDLQALPLASRFPAPAADSGSTAARATASQPAPQAELAPVMLKKLPAVLRSQQPPHAVSPTTVASAPSPKHRAAVANHDDAPILVTSRSAASLSVALPPTATTPTSSSNPAPLRQRSSEHSPLLLHVNPPTVSLQSQ